MHPLDDETRRAIVRPHIHDTRCYLLSQRPPCTTVARQQQDANRLRKGPQPAGRDIVLVRSDGIAALNVPKSWLLVALLCEGDDITELAAWVKADIRARVERVRFFHHVDASPIDALQAWVKHGLPFPRLTSFTDQRNLSARFGRAILQQIVDDWGNAA